MNTFDDVNKHVRGQRWDECLLETHTRVRGHFTAPFIVPTNFGV
jgi:hypothetical protein